MKSKFTFISVFSVSLIMLVCIAFFIAMLIFSFLQIIPFTLFLIFLLPISFMITWLFWGEFRTKLITAELGIDYISIKKFGGLGKEEKYFYNEFDGFKISVLPAANNAYEYLYIIKGNNKIIKLSSFYHKNYNDLKTEIKSKLKYLGYEDFNYGKEIKEWFS